VKKAAGRRLEGRGDGKKRGGPGDWTGFLVTGREGGYRGTP